MKDRFAQSNLQHPAPCRGARRLVLIAVGATLLAFSCVTADLLLGARHANKMTLLWTQRLTLSSPALWSAGDPRRHPEMMHPGVDIRFCAGLEGTP